MGYKLRPEHESTTEEDHAMMSHKDILNHTYLPLFGFCRAVELKIQCIFDLMPDISVCSCIFFLSGLNLVTVCLQKCGVKMDG